MWKEKQRQARKKSKKKKKKNKKKNKRRRRKKNSRHSRSRSNSPKSPNSPIFSTSSHLSQSFAESSESESDGDVASPLATELEVLKSIKGVPTYAIPLLSFDPLPEPIQELAKREGRRVLEMFLPKCLSQEFENITDPCIILTVLKWRFSN